MSIPDFQTLMLPVLEESARGEVSIHEAIARLADRHALTPEERAQRLPSGRQTTFANRVHWAKSYLGKARLIELTRRAHFRITPRGREVLASPPPRIDIAFLKRFAEFAAFRPDAPVREDAPPDATPTVPAGTAPAAEAARSGLTPDEVMRAAHRELDAALAAELLERVMAGTPAFFEALVVRLLLAMGYGGSAAELDAALMVVGGAGDGGIDGVIDQDPLGLDRVYVQAKRYGEDKPVGAGAIRDFFGSLDGVKAAKGLFVTTSTFTGSARATADALSKRIVLIDGGAFARLMIRYGVGCRVEETLTVRRLDEEFFEG